ncbi:MAG: PEGA domain-containing protein, partial [Polyangiaceae bacterium]|nr:PEGA domain-containing protein [Polyangiaceae bacterium]
EAVAELGEAYRLWENPAILYALGQAHEGLTQVRQAIEVYRRYLDAAPPDDIRRDDVQARIEQLERLLATIRVTANIGGTLYVNDEPEGEVPGEFRLPTGRHRLEVRADGYAPARQSIVIAAGTDRELFFELSRLASSTTTQILQISERRRLPRPVFYSMVGVTGASALTWVSLGTVTLVRRAQYNDLLTRDPVDEREARDWARRSDIVLGVTGGLAAATLVVGLLTEWGGDGARENEARPELDVAFLPEGAALSLISGGTIDALDGAAVDIDGAALASECDQRSDRGALADRRPSEHDDARSAHNAGRAHRAARRYPLRERRFRKTCELGDRLFDERHRRRTRLARAHRLRDRLRGQRERVRAPSRRRLCPRRGRGRSRDHRRRQLQGAR